MDVTKVKVLDIKTQDATKNVENLTKSFIPLKQQIKDLTNQLSQLEKGTEEYDRVSKQLADTKQRQIEINEAAKYSNKDFGQTMANLTTASMGLVGGINAISASMALLGGDAEDMRKALVPIQLTMAAIQGFAAIDKAVKALKGLTVAFGSVGESAGEAVDEVGKLETSLEGIDSKSVNVSVDATAAEEGVSELEGTISKIGDKDVSISVDVDGTEADEEVSKISSDLESLSDKSITIDADGKPATGEIDTVRKEIESLSGETVRIDADTKEATSGIEEVKTEVGTLPTDKDILIDVEAAGAAAGAEAVRTEVETIPPEKDIHIEVDSEGAVAEIEAVKLEVETIPETKVVNVESTGIDDMSSKVTKLTGEEAKLTKQTEQVSKATNTMGKSGNILSRGLKSVTTGIKAAAAAFKSFIASNPILLAIAAAIGAVAGGIALLNKYMEKNGRVAKEEADLLSDVNSQYQEQTIRLNVLNKTASDQNESLAERKKAVEELNKIVPNYNAQINETTGALEANNKAMEDYMANLKEKLKLEAYEGKIKEYLEKQAELQKEINDLETTGWWFVQARVRSRKKDIAEFEKDIDRLYGKIQQLDLGKALDSNKVDANANKTAKAATTALKKIEDAIKELKKQSKDLWDILFNSKIDMRKFQGPANALKDFQDQLNNILHTSDFTEQFQKDMNTVGYNVIDIFTKEFQDFVKKGEKSMHANFFNGFNFDDVFKDTGHIEELQKHLAVYGAEIDKTIIKYQKLADSQGGKLTAAQSKRFEEEKKQYDISIQNIQKELDGYNSIMNAVYDYTKAVRDNRQAEEEQQLETVRLNKELQIQKDYLNDLARNDYYADSTRNIKNQENEIDILKRQNDMLKQRVETLKQNSNANGLYENEIKEINERILENERQLAQREIELDTEKHNRRLLAVEKYYTEVDKSTAQLVKDIETRSSILGFGTAAFDVAYKQQKVIVDAAKKKLKELDKQYSEAIAMSSNYYSEMERLKNQYESGQISEEQYEAEMEATQAMYEEYLLMYQEYLTRKNEMTEEYNEKEKELNAMQAQNRIDTMMAVYNAMSQIQSLVGQILDSEMDKYDENSEEYRKLAIARSVMDTIMGSFSAFISGVQSGIPAPYNFILGGVLATLTTALGVANIAKLKSGNTSGVGGGNVSSAVANIGTSTYETTAYGQQTELMGGITDTRVYVTENDITSTQNKVAVRENNATY